MLVKVTEAFLIMELVDGKPLDVRPPTDMMDILDTFIQAAQGAESKCTNWDGPTATSSRTTFCATDRGQVKVIDFGQSCKIGTVKERIQGTPDYNRAGAGETAGRSRCRRDVFNLGATLYWNLTGKHIPTLYTVNKQGREQLSSGYTD